MVFEISYKPDVLTNKLPRSDTFEASRLFLNEKVMFTTFALVDLKSFRTRKASISGFYLPFYNTQQDEYRSLVSTALVPRLHTFQLCNPEDVALAVDAMGIIPVDTRQRSTMSRL